MTTPPTGDAAGEVARAIRLAGAPVIPGYVFDSQIGRGGFATVYAAHQEAVGASVAVKVLDAAPSDPDALLRFRRETRAMGALRGHPHIVTVLDAGVAEDGRPYIVMELIRSGSLHSLLTRRRKAGEGPVAAAEALSIAIKVASALAAAHAAGIIHRDLKPGNVLLSDYGEPLLTDFGVARLADHEASVNSSVLSAGFSAPEVIQGGQPSVASDIFAFGCTIHALMAGASPFRLPGDADILAALNRTVEAAPPDLRATGVPAEFCTVLESCLAKDPAQRPVNAVAVVKALQRAQVSLGQSVTTPPLPAETDDDEPSTSIVDVGAALGGPPPTAAAADPPTTELGGRAAGPGREPAAESPVPPAGRSAGRSAAFLAGAAAVVVLVVVFLLGDRMGGGQDGVVEDAARIEDIPFVLSPGTGVSIEADSPRATDLDTLYGEWGSDINAGLIEDAYAYYDAALQETYPIEQFETDLGALYIRGLVVQSAEEQGDRLVVEIAYVTTEQEASGRRDGNCLRRTERHTLQPEGQELRIAAVEELAPPEPC